MDGGSQTQNGSRAFDFRVIACEWAMAKGWSSEIVGSTVTVRDGNSYVVVEVDFSSNRRSSALEGSAFADFEKSALHVAVVLSGQAPSAMRRWLKAQARRSAQ
jgi:hypothetical protein